MQNSKGSDYSGFLFLSVLILGISLFFFLWGGLNELAVRFLTTRAQQLRILRMTLWPSLTVCAAGLTLWNRRSATGPLDGQWWKKVGQWILLILFAMVFVSMWSDSAIRIALHHYANRPEVLEGHVKRAGVHRSGKGTDVRNYADIVTTSGEVLNVSSYRSIFTFVTRNAVKVNGTCELDKLTEGYPVTIHGRRSQYGFALDAITSTAQCEQ